MNEMSGKRTSYLQKIGSLMLESKLKEALKVAEKGLAENPDDGALHQQCAEILFLQRDFPRAIEEYRCALKLGMDNPHLHKNLGIALLEDSRYKDAVGEFERACRMEPGDFTLKLNLAGAYILSGESEQAEKLFGKLTREFPKEGEVHYQYGLFLGGQQRYEEAVAAYTKAIKRKKKEARYLLSRGGAYASLGKLLEAKEDFERSCKLHPDNPLAFNNLGYCYFLEGAYQRAIPLFRRAVELDGDYYLAYQNLGAALAMSGELVEAESVFRRSTEMDPSQPEGFHNLGRTLHQLGRDEDAVKPLREGAELGDKACRELLGKIEDKL